MTVHSLGSLADVRGRLAVATNGHTGLFERAHYLHPLYDWSTAHAASVADGR